MGLPAVRADEVRPPGPAPRWTGSLRFTLQALVGTLVLLLLAGAGATAWARWTVAHAQDTLGSVVLPARQAASALSKAYVDQETGERGFLLTGDPSFLEPYAVGARDVTRLQADLDRLLADDRAGRLTLAAVTAAGAEWERQAAAPEIAARRGGAPSDAQLRAVAPDGKARFDALRVQLTALEGHTAALTTEQLRRIDAAQATANAVAATTAALALLVACAALVLLRRGLTRPLTRLLGQVEAVARGSHDTAITATGPRELAAIAADVERMRTSLLEHSAELVATQQELVVRQEQNRLATDLHDLTIQRLFALGLGLTSVSRRTPEAAAALAPLIEETGRITHEIRTVIFDLAGTGRRSPVEEAAGLPRPPS